MVNVVMTIVGTQRDAYGEEDRIELVTAGHYHERNGVRYLTYKDSEISGMEGVATMLKIYEQHVVLVRTGNVRCTQEFHLGRKSQSCYATDYIAMKMNILTKSMTVALAGPSGTIEISYDLEINGQWQSDNTLLVSVREEI